MSWEAKPRAGRGTQGSSLSVWFFSSGRGVDPAGSRRLIKRAACAAAAASRVLTPGGPGLREDVTGSACERRGGCGGHDGSPGDPGTSALEFTRLVFFAHVVVFGVAWELFNYWPHVNAHGLPPPPSSDLADF